MITIFTQFNVILLETMLLQRNWYCASLLNYHIKTVFVNVAIYGPGEN